MSIDEKQVEEFFHDQGITVTKLEEGENKSPDFIAEHPSGYCFYVEVKALEPFPDNQGIDWNQLNQRLASAVRKAVKQFRSVNSAHFSANVLCLISRDFGLTSAESLITAMDGVLVVSDGDAYLARPEYGGRKLIQYRKEIDLIVLLPDKGGQSFIYLQKRKEHVRKLSRLFGHNSLIE